MEFAAAQDVERRKKDLKPVPSATYAESALQQHWAVRAARIESIVSYDDFNFYVEDSEGSMFLLKFFNGVESANGELLAGYSAMMSHLDRNCAGLQFQSACPTTAGTDVATVTDCPVFCGQVGVCVAVRLFTWIRGVTMSAAGASADLLYREGVAVGKISLCLQSFSHPGLQRVQFWDGRHFVSHVSPFVHMLAGESGGLQFLVQRALDQFENDVLPAAAVLPMSCVMGDCNDANIIVTEEPHRDVRGFIDFGDAVYSWGILELANAMVSGQSPVCSPY